MVQTFGGCTLSLIPVRTEPADRSELCTQLLFGDAYSVLALSPDEKWLHIRIAADGYTGWIDRGQHWAISEEAYCSLSRPDLPFVSEACARLFYPQTGQSQWLCRGSYLPFLVNPGLQGPDLPPWQWEAPCSLPPQTLSQKTLRHWAESYQYSPYLWGGKSPWGIDCSGFTQMVFRMSGFALWRDARQQATQGQEIPIREAQTGDLAFFARQGKVVHVGIVIAPEEVIGEALYPAFPRQSGEYYIWHALDQVRLDKLDARGIFHLQRQVYTHELHSLRHYGAKPED